MFDRRITILKKYSAMFIVTNNSTHTIEKNLTFGPIENTEYTKLIKNEKKIQFNIFPIGISKTAIIFT